MPEVQVVTVFPDGPGGGNPAPVVRVAEPRTDARIAAAALLFGLRADGLVLEDDRPVTVRQGRAMGRASAITVQFDRATGGCWLGGPVTIGD